MTLNDNWGWHAGDFHWKSAGQVIQLLLTCAEKGGNLLLNVGPKEDGTIPEESVRILDEAGEWLARHREVVTESERHPFSWNCTARPVTVRGSRIFLHFLNDPPRPALSGRRRASFPAGGRAPVSRQAGGGRSSLHRGT